MGESDSYADALVLGVGNILMQDDGLGVRAVERLHQSYHLPEGVQALDGGVQGLDLLSYLENAGSLIVVDAVNLGKAPGTISRLQGREIASLFALKMSVHQVGLQELFAVCTLRGTLPSRVVLWGIEPTHIALGTCLSPSVRNALDPLVDAIATELKEWGFRLQRAATVRVGQGEA